MIQEFKKQWQQFKDAEPGHRFQDRYDRHKKEAHDSGINGKMFTIVLGLIVTIVGLVLIPAPGPGTIIFFLGLSLLGSEFLPLAKFLDKAELRLRPWVEKARPLVEKAQNLWKRTSLAVKGAVGFVAFACAACIAYGAYQVFLTMPRG
jgi:uncharacterized protein (TIGR02611 family)